MGKARHKSKSSTGPIIQQSTVTATPGQSPVVFPTRIVTANTVAFALCFAMWVMFGPSVRAISNELGIAPWLANIIKAVPILVGSVCRIPVGVLTDRLGARLMFPLLMLVAAAATIWLSFATTLTAIIVGGLVMGFAGTTFAVGAQSTSSWTPQTKQGFALGIFGAGNVGTAITTLGLPLLIAAIGWRHALQVYAGVITAAAVGYWCIVRNAPRKGASPTLSGLLAPLKDLLAWKLGLYYMATFGVFVAATLILSDIYVDGYAVKTTVAGLLATTFTFTASLCRIPGGWIADRVGPSIVCRTSLLVIAVALAPVVVGLPLAAMVLCVFVSAVAMGFGMASSFKFIPEYYPKTVGAVSGIVGALGGVGGFVLPLLGGMIKSKFGSAQLQILPLFALALAALVTLVWSERVAKRTMQRIVGATGSGWPALPENAGTGSWSSQHNDDERELVKAGREDQAPSFLRSPAP
jgi:NNP family nitrate/nitrite transporter-like MFS transporter